eukprot:361445-Chlamydomonas_euryale.AAC.5
MPCGNGAKNEQCLDGNDPPNFGIPIFRLSTVCHVSCDTRLRTAAVAAVAEGAPRAADARLGRPQHSALAGPQHHRLR